MSTVYVCPERDIECGRSPETWCATCPQRTTAQPREQADHKRDLFEAHLGPCDLRQFSDGTYVDAGVNKAWGGWQAALALTRQAAPEAPLWRCFHCEESFIDRNEAALHFGNSERQYPACKLDAKHLREIEAELEKYRDEDTELHHEIAGQQARLAAATRRAEEEGYARGLRDAHLLDPVAAPEAPTQHPDDLAVDRFAVEMKAKMEKSRAKGRGGWDDPAQCTVEQLAAMLVSHVEKGDPVDIANFAMMIQLRGGCAIDVYEALAVFLNARQFGASTGAAPEAPASEQQNQADRVVEWSAAKATTASASGERCEKCAGTGWRIGSVPCPYCRATAPSRNAAPVGPALREITRAIVGRLGWTINGTFVVTKSGDNLHTADAISFVHASLTQQGAAPVECLRCEGRGTYVVMDDDTKAVGNIRCAECDGTGQGSTQAAHAGADTEQLANRVRDLIADHVADNWPMVRHPLEEVDKKLRAINAGHLLKQADAALAATEKKEQK